MICYLKGYYGYQNRGDELLLFGVLWYIDSHLDNLSIIYIEAGDVDFLTQRVSQHKAIIGEHIYKKLRVISKWNIIQFFPRVIKCIGGGEVISDSRTFPYNGWNYLILYRLSLICGRVVFLGGIGQPKSWISKLLWIFLLKGANKVIVREQVSYQRVFQYTTRVLLYRDFALDVLDRMQLTHRTSTLLEQYILINCNSHYRNETVISKIQDFCHQYPHHRYIYFSAAMSDDKDGEYFDQLRKYIPTLTYYDWRQYSLEETLSLFAGASAGIGTRLHVLLLLHYFNIPFYAFIYQEKITKILGIHYNTL